jgi:AcrR family transcriptional regulator
MNEGQGVPIPVALTPGVPSPRRRSDAERNRLRILGAARVLVAERGFSGVTMDDVAQAAGVGKGTVYRAFRSRSGLAEELLDAAELELQESLLRGPPPLGPGADPESRLIAFISAYLAFLEDNVELLLETEGSEPGARLHTGAYAFWHLHLSALLRGLRRTDPSVLAHVLLAGLSADLYVHLTAGLAVQAEELLATLTELVACAAHGPRPADPSPRRR